MFADDIKIYGIYGSGNCNEVRRALSTSLEKMNSWALQWDIPLNLNKTMVMHLGECEPFIYEVSGVKLTSCRSTKDLGVLFESNLKFSTHISRAVTKAYAALFLILRNIRCSDPAILIRLYKAYVLPHLEYASPVWNPKLKKEVRRIEKVQQMFTRILWYRSTASPERHLLPDYNERLRIFALRSLEHRRTVSDLIFCFRVLRKEVRLPASKYWIFRPTSARSGGFSLHYPNIHKRHYSLLFDSLFYRGARWLQLLPSEVLRVDNSKAFRKRLKNLDLSCILSTT